MLCDRCKKASEKSEKLIIKGEQATSELNLCLRCVTQARAFWMGFMRPKQKDLEELTDDTVIWFGKFKGKKFRDVPASYFLWLGDQDKVQPNLMEYINKNRDVLEEEVENED